MLCCQFWQGLPKHARPNSTRTLVAVEFLSAGEEIESPVVAPHQAALRVLELPTTGGGLRTELPTDRIRRCIVERWVGMQESSASAPTSRSRLPRALPSQRSRVLERLVAPTSRSRRHRRPATRAASNRPRPTPSPVAASTILNCFDSRLLIPGLTFGDLLSASPARRDAPSSRGRRDIPEEAEDRLRPTARYELLPGQSDRTSSPTSRTR